MFVGSERRSDVGGSQYGRSLVRVACIAVVCLVTVVAGAGVSLSAGARGTRSHVAYSGARLSKTRSSARAELARMMRREKARTARRRWLDSPRARTQRIASQMAFHDLSVDSAQHLLVDNYGSVLKGVSSNPAVSLAQAGSLVRYLSDYRAVVRTAKGLEVETSTVPLRVSHGRGPTTGGE